MSDVELRERAASDAELLGRFIARRDPSAFERIVRRHGPLVLRVCRDVLGDADDAEDAFQATFLVLVRRAEAIRDGDSLGRWLYGVATRVAGRCRVQVRRRQARERQGAAMWASLAESGDDALRELGPILHAELRRLPERLRTPIVLCYFEGRTYEDAARTLSLPLGTLKGRLVKGREVLRSRLSRRGLAVTALLLMTMLRREAQAVPPELVEATVHAGLRSAGGTPLSDAVAARVRRLIDRELQGPSLGPWATLGTLALGLIGAGSLWLFLARPAGGRAAFAATGPAVRSKRPAVAGPGLRAPSVSRSLHASEGAPSPEYMARAMSRGACDPQDQGVEHH